MSKSFDIRISENNELMRMVINNDDNDNRRSLIDLVET